jgi:hypothetical protein
LRLRVAWTSGSKYEFVIEFSLMEFDTKLLGSPARAIPLLRNKKKQKQKTINFNFGNKMECFHLRKRRWGLIHFSLFIHERYSMI